MFKKKNITLITLSTIWLLCVVRVNPKGCFYAAVDKSCRTGRDQHCQIDNAGCGMWLDADHLNVAHKNGDE